jgi:CheY-like chemotaxis protein
MKTVKILVAEDDPALLHSFRVRLSSRGYEVLCASDANQAIALAGEHQPDLLILDVHLPSGDGFSVEERIRKMPNLSLIPTIYVSGDRSQELLDRAQEHGVRWLLNKPFNTAELMNVISQTLEQDERQGEPVVVR